MNLAKVFFLLVLLLPGCVGGPEPVPAGTRPNILLILTDDQSWAHTGMEHYPLVKTPNFDALAKRGVYFHNAYVSAPTCTASRSAILTGQDFYRTGSGAVLMGTYPKELYSYQEILQAHGYRTGFTGKGWGPGYQFNRGTLTGEQYNHIQKTQTPEGVSPTNYSANFDAFLADGKPGQPFSFWVGIQEPHRRVTRFSGEGYAENAGDYFATPEQQRYLPDFLPQTEYVHKDFQGYLMQIEQLDGELGRVLAVLEKHQQLDNTLIVFASDNGMPFPGAKSNNSLYGNRVPLAIVWGNHLRRMIDDKHIISLTDLASTFLEAAGVPRPAEMTGVSLYPLLLGKKFESPREGFVITGFERHAPDARANHASYPSRAIITHDYMFIHNFLPDLWPFGDPPIYGDGQSYLLWKDVKNQKQVDYLVNWLCGKRPAEMLFDVQKDPFQKHNLLADPQQAKRYEPIANDLRQRLQTYLEQTQDPILKDPHYFQKMPFATMQ